MKTKVLSILIPLALAATSLPAANIAWVSFHAADDSPSANAAAAGFTSAPDVGYTALLTAQGHNVTRFVTVANMQNFPDTLAAMNTNDLVIISRSVPSGHYDTTDEVAAWNGVSQPMMILSGYLSRNNRLGLTTGTTMADANSTNISLQVNAPGHPIFAGVALDGANLMVNPYAQRITYTNAGVETLQNGISVNNNTLPAVGTVLATVGTPGDAALNGMIIGEYPVGTTTAATVGATVLPAKRLMFLTGSRESGITGDGAGIYDLYPDGETMFLNAVTYMTSQAPLPPECTTALIGATNLLAGDSWTFDAGVIGSNPRTYQWYKSGQPVPAPAGTDITLDFPSLTLADAGAYQLYVTNEAGWATSTVASLEFAVVSAPSITNSLVSYWPLDEVVGTKTPDLVSGYDMTLVNMAGSNVVTDAKWGKAFSFDNAAQTILQRINAPGEALPIYQHPNFTVSLWVNGWPNQLDRRIFAEGTTTNNTPLFDLGTHVGGTDGTVDIYIRNDSGTTAGNHLHSVATAFDYYVWHNIVYVQRQLSPTTMKGQLYVDGVLDTVEINPVRPISATTTAIGGMLRTSASAWFTGSIDEVAVWSRALSTAEVGILQTTYITNPPSIAQPLVLNSFKADRAAVSAGGSTVLRWDVSKDASQVTIDKLGDVTGSTSVGIGSTNIAPTEATTYVLTVQRGLDSLSATTSVSVVEGVTAGWKVLDNFDQAQPGPLFAAGYWNDTSGTAGQVAPVNGNKAVTCTSGGISFLNLQGLTIQELQACTLFFRIMPGAANAAGVTNIVGLTDKSQRSYGDEFQNIGPVLYAAAFTNDTAGATSNGWYLGARNGFAGDNVSNPIDYYDYVNSKPLPLLPMEAGSVYNVWIDVTNAPWSNYQYVSDTFSVYIQKEGGAARQALFTNYTSDRDLFYVDPVLGGIAPNLDKLVLMGNSATVSAVFDDFYLSTTGYNATVPVPYTISLQPGPVSATWAGSQLQINWSNGTLQSSPTANGPYVDVPGNPVPPYLVTPTGAAMFYRARQ